MIEIYLFSHFWFWVTKVEANNYFYNRPLKRFDNKSIFGVNVREGDHSAKRNLHILKNILQKLLDSIRNEISDY